MLALFIAGAAAAGPAVLRPEEREGRALVGETVIEVTRDGSLPDEPIAIRHATEHAGDDTLRLTTWVQIPEGLDLLGSELVVQVEVRLDADGAATEVTSLRDDLAPLVAWLGPATHPAAPAPREVVAASGCNALAFYALLPAEPLEPGATWSVGEMRCTLEEIRGNVATVQCLSRHRLDDPWAEHQVEAEHALEIDIAERYVRACSARQRHERAFAGSGGAPMDQRWTQTERWTAEPGPPVQLGRGPIGRALALLGAAGALVAAGLALVFLQRRRRS